MRRWAFLLVVFASFVFQEAALGQQNGSDLYLAPGVNRLNGRLASEAVAKNLAALLGNAPTQPPASPIPVLWSLIKGQYPGLISVPISATNNGIPSVALLVQPDAASNLPAVLPQIWALTVANIVGSLPQLPLTDCGAGNSADQSNCCMRAPYPECVQRSAWQYCDTAAAPDLCRNIEKTNVLLAIWRQVAFELASNSRFVKEAEFFPGADGGQLFFIWPYLSNNAEYKEKVLVTAITGDLIDRLLTVSNGALGTLQRVQGQPTIQKLECMSGSQGFASFPILGEDKANALYVSLGRPTAARLLPNQGSSWSVSLYVETEPTLMRMALVPGIGAAMGTNSKWHQFAGIAKVDPERSLECLSSVKLKDLAAIENQMNNADSGLFIFGLAYLKSAYSVFVK